MAKNYIGIIDTYLGDVCSDGGKERSILKKIRSFSGREKVAFPRPKDFLSVSKARRVAEKFRVEAYAVLPFGSWLHHGNYINVDGDFGKIGEENPEEFFYQINFARFSTQQETIPKNEFWYATVGGDFPDKLIPFLKKHSNLFNGVKIGVFRPQDFQFTDPRYKPLWEFCEQKQWPILAHCSCSNPKNFYDLFETAKKYPNARFCASHLGGEDESHIRDRAVFLANDDAIPQNFFSNIVVRNLKLARILLDAKPEFLNHLVFGTDIPFLGWYRKVIRTLRRNFTDGEIGIIMDNGRKFLGL